MKKKIIGGQRSAGILVILITIMSFLLTAPAHAQPHAFEKGTSLKGGSA